MCHSFLYITKGKYQTNESEPPYCGMRGGGFRIILPLFLVFVLLLPLAATVVNGNVYGGGNQGRVGGNTEVVIRD